MFRFLLMIIPLAIHTFIDYIIIGLYTRKNPYGEMNNRLMRNWCKLILNMCGIKLISEGLEHVITDHSCIILANHQSAFDIPVIGFLINATVRFMAKKEIFQIPILGSAMKGAGIFIVDRQNRTQAIESIKKAIQLLQQNTIAIVGFPEGTRTPDGQVHDFKKGLFMMALDSGVPILPVSISGADKRAKKKSINIRPGPIKVVVHPPVDVTRYGNANRDQLIKDVRDIIISQVDPNFGG